MDVAYAVPVLVALAAAFLAVRHVANRQRRLLDQYRKRRARGPTTLSPHTDSARSEMRAQENPTTTLSPTPGATNGRMTPPARTRDKPPKGRRPASGRQQ